jgi:hypothetical protein
MAPRGERGYVAPQPLARDAFTTGPGILSIAAARFVRIVLKAAPTIQIFDQQLVGTDLRTLVVGTAESLHDALQGEILSLHSASWPQQARAKIAADVRRLQALIAISDPPIGTAAFARWRTQIKTRLSSAEAATTDALRALDAPDIVPNP